MDKFVTDQAEGLRRLLAYEGPRVIAVTGGPGAQGATTTVVNLAAALTGLGKNVLVIDETAGGQSVAATLGAVRAADGFDALMRDELSFDDAVTRHAPGFGVLAAPRGNAARYSAEQLGRVLNGPADIVLIDAQLDDDGALSPLALHAHDVLIVTRITAQEITVTYACIKRLHFAHAIGQFHVVANHVQSQADAQVVLDNLVGVASRYLSVSLDSAGCIAADPHMPRAVELARCIVDAFPSTAAARDYRRLASELPHWPMRPALAARSSASIAEASAAFAERTGPLSSADGLGGARVEGLPDVPEVSTDARVTEAAPAYASWQTGPTAPRRPTHHA
ncbi:flagellar biosynthesis protein FlhG [Paraburkholderia caballeronis]|nr:flagellar biosynthesis protein FlhG [Paraburkholderia caballeronis]TDV11887.1 flagellar biosynthesis protein FlhG [Paraburkholderia caballeronis]TDV20341.1 flagellar biosynthesis protein FlhG [Paraburkholderia caballeronis]